MCFLLKSKHWIILSRWSNYFRFSENGSLYSISGITLYRISLSSLEYILYRFWLLRWRQNRTLNDLRSDPDPDLQINPIQLESILLGKKSREKYSIERTWYQSWPLRKIVQNQVNLIFFDNKFTIYNRNSEKKLFIFKC